MRRIGQDKLPPAIDLGRAVPDGGICRPRAKGELREPPDEVRREVVAALQACSAPGRKGCETPLAQVVTALGPWWRRNQDSTLPEVLADLIATRGRGALAAEVADKVGRITRERAEAELDGLRGRLAKVGFLLREDGEGETMISDDERREVAERLRVYSHDFDFGDSNQFWYVAKAAFGDVDVHTYYSVFARLADLIDRPTCRICATDHEYEDSVRCDRCLMTFRRPWEPFKYCPNCGAEVKDDAEPNLKEN